MCSQRNSCARLSRRALRRLNPVKVPTRKVPVVFEPRAAASLLDNICDAVRGILDGHIVLDRAIAERGRFPAINILKSVSRAMPACNTPAEQEIVAQARKQIAVYDDMAELIRLGAYKMGTNAEVDVAIGMHPQFEKFLEQRKDERATLTEGYGELSRIVRSGVGKGKSP